MRNIYLEIEYTGKDHFGWQIQENKKTIQGDIQKAIRKVLQEDVKLIGAGRTDAKVAARKQVANFLTNSELKLENIKNGINSKLPSSISINKIKEVPEDFHSRYNAKKKTYIYSIITERSAINHEYTYYYKRKLDINLMNMAIKKLIGEHDFKAFKASKSNSKSSVRTIYSASVYQDDTDKRIIRIKICGNGFLYNMVRIIAGTILEIGEGKRKLESIDNLLEDKKREDAGRTLPAHGLMLENIEY